MPSKDLDFGYDILVYGHSPGYRRRRKFIWLDRRPAGSELYLADALRAAGNMQRSLAEFVASVSATRDLLVTRKDALSCEHSGGICLGTAL
jgi:hypothetical protein